MEVRSLSLVVCRTNGCRCQGESTSRCGEETTQEASSGTIVDPIPPLTLHVEPPPAEDPHAPVASTRRSLLGRSVPSCKCRAKLLGWIATILRSAGERLRAAPGGT